MLATLIAEIDAQLVALAPVHEGLRDFGRLNIRPESLQDVRALVALYDRRVTVLEKAKAVLLELQADGYPLILPREVPDAVLEDLRAQSTTIAAALARFTSGAAVGIGLEPGATEPK